MCLVKISTVTKAGPAAKLSSSSSSSRGITRHSRLVIKNVKQEYKHTHSLSLHCLVSPTSPGPLLWTSAAPHKVLTCDGLSRRDQQTRVSCEKRPTLAVRSWFEACRNPVVGVNGAKNEVSHKTTRNKLNTFGIDRRTTYHLHKKHSHSTNIWHERERDRSASATV